MFRLFIVILAVFCFGCKNEPRSTSRQQQKTEDARDKYMLQLNRRMVEQQDSLFKIITDTSVLEWTRTTSGYYLAKTKKTEQDSITPGSLVSISYVLKTVRNEPLDTMQATFYAGKSQDIVPGVQYAVLKMRNAEKASVLLPYTLAFGVKGLPGKIAPYQPLWIEISIEKVEKR